MVVAIYANGRLPSSAKMRKSVEVHRSRSAHLFRKFLGAPSIFHARFLSNVWHFHATGFVDVCSNARLELCLEDQKHMAVWKTTLLKLNNHDMDDYFAPPLADKQPPRPPGQAAPPPPVQPLPQSPAQPQGAGDPLVPGNNARPKPSTGGRSMGSKWRRGGGQSMASKSSCSDPSKRNTKLCVALAVAVLLLIVVLIFTFIVLLHVFEVMTLIPAFLPPPECHAPS